MDGLNRNSDGLLGPDGPLSPVKAPSREERAALRASLSQPLPEISPRYFYDDAGSELFERITDLPVYYQTRTEISILERWASEIIENAAPRHVVELGSGAGRKIRLLLDAWARSSGRGICTMLDINELFLHQSIDRLQADYPWCDFRSVVGDFSHDLDRIGPAGRRLVVFFGGTIGNLYPEQRHAFLRKVAAGMGDSDTFLVGVDLVKDAARLEAAYDDPEGVTAAFNRNMLKVLNRTFGANFAPERFKHRALYDVENEWIEMRLVATEATQVRIRALDLELKLRQGQEIRTEISCKFTQASLARALGDAGLEISGWYTDPADLFALALVRKCLS